MGWRLLLVMGGLLGFPACGRGWSAFTHAEIARRVLDHLPAGLAASGRRHRKELVAGSLAPDRRGPGWIPPRAHVVHEGDGPRALGIAAIGSLESWLAARSPEAPGWWFQAGRLVHLVSDLAQPLHTATSPEEARLHAPFERWCARLNWPVTPAGAPDAPLPLAALAAAGRREYGFLMRAFPDVTRHRELARRSRLWRRRGVEQAAARLRALAVPGGGAADGRATWWLSALLWFGLLERRLRLAGSRG